MELGNDLHLLAIDLPREGAQRMLSEMSGDRYGQA